MKTPFFRTEHNYDRDQVSTDTATYNKEKSLTKQEFVEDADINNIIERFGISHEMPLTTMPPLQGDFTAIPDYRGAMEITRKAQKIFDSLPAKIRSRFDNDTANYIDFFQDPANIDEAVALGLAKRTPLTEAQPKVDLPPAAPSAAGGQATPPTPPTKGA